MSDASSVSDAGPASETGSDPVISVRPVTSSDENRWRELFRAYREFYNLAESEEIVSRVWGWLSDPAHESSGLVASMSGEVVGIGNYRRFARPSTGSVGLWLDDLFTDPDVRGRGVARAIITHLTEIAGDEDLSVVRWITAEDNAQAQALYDQVANRTHWVTYDASPQNRSESAAGTPSQNWSE